MEIPWKLKMLLVAVFGQDRVKNRRVFTPDFSESSFSQLHPARELPNSTREQIVDYYLSRDRPDFFVATDQVLPLANEIEQQFPDWKAGIVDAASATCDRGLPIYNQRAAALTGEFPWKELGRGPYADQLFISRPQRFGFAPVLAQAALFDRKFISSLDEILVGWQQYAVSSRYRWPYNSSHAVVYRVIALCWCWLFVGAIDEDARDSSTTSILYSILAILKNDILYLGPRLGTAHPNNHLLADYFVGWLLQHTFSGLIPDSMDFSHFEQKWQAELRRQFYSDGGCFEHAIHYHEHGCEMAMIYRLLADKSGIPTDLDKHIGAILRFQARLNGPLCKPWALGDTTEDTLLPLDNTLGWSSRAILAVHEYHYPEQSLRFGNMQMDQKSYWLLAGKKASPQIKREVASIVESYSDSGFVHWLSQGDSNELLFRTGVSSGSDSMPGHMHADILSLYWRVGDVDLLAASGSYSYKFWPQKTGNYREYFCGPRSHSSVLIDGKDPLGVLDKSFRSTDNGLRVSHYLCGSPSIANFCVAEVHSENCYDGLRRGVMYLPGGPTIVLDIFTETQCSHEVSTGWLFDKALDIRRDDDSLDLRMGDHTVARIISMEGLNAQLHSGEVSPILGWQSDSYGAKMPTQYASFVHPLGTRVAVFVLATQNDLLPCVVDSTFSAGDQLLVNLIYGFGRDTLYFNLADIDQEIDIGGVRLKSRAIIHQQRHESPDNLIALDCIFIDFDGLAAKHCSPAETLRFEKLTDISPWEPV